MKKKPEQRHLRHEWDVVDTTLEGFVIWRRYGDRKLVITSAKENPRDALLRQLREARKKKGKGGSKR